MTQYARGTAFERTVAKRLEEDGYYVVRAAGSRGAADLVALKTGHVVLVQCKLGGIAELGTLPWNKFLATAKGVGALAVVASRPQRGVVAYHRLVSSRVPRNATGPCAQEWKPDELVFAEVVDDG